MLHELLLVASTMAYCTEAKYVEGNLKTDKVRTGNRNLTTGCGKKVAP